MGPVGTAVMTKLDFFFKLFVYTCSILLLDPFSMFAFILEELQVSRKFVVGSQLRASLLFYDSRFGQ